MHLQEARNCEVRALRVAKDKDEKQSQANDWEEKKEDGDRKPATGKNTRNNTKSKKVAHKAAARLSSDSEDWEIIDRQMAEMILERMEVPV